MRIALVVGLMMAGLTAHAQIEEVVPKQEIKRSEKVELGWAKKLILGGSISMGKSENVIGQADGQSNTYGLNLEGHLNNNQENSEWRNELKVGESASRTPAVPRYVKVKDELKIDTMYLHTFDGIDWVGPYAKGSVETSIFKGEDVRATSQVYQLPSGSTVTASSIRLTDGFKPVTTKESAGAFFKIINKETMTLEARTGLGAVQVNANGQLAIKDNSSTSNVEIVELESFEQLGVEGALAWKGNIDAKTSYSLEGEFLTPFVTGQSATDKRDKLELTNWEVKGRLTTKLYEWLSLDYTAKLYKQPLLLDKTQNQSLLMVSMTYQLL